MKSKKNFTSAVSIILILIATSFSFNSQMPSPRMAANLPETEFSLNKALVHLKEISQKPHFVGSMAHAEVRDYIIAELETLGLNVEIQTQMVFGKKNRVATEVNNIITKIKGRQSGKSLLLLSHYDSAVYSSFGASDAGSGVVTILEGIRAYLARGIVPKNDIIILISDAEEIGLLGAQAFVEKHRWAKDVGLVLNFEARGSGGPSYMLMETNAGNKNLIKAFNKANPQYPVANSFLYSIYKTLPNDTDLTIFREFGNINGFNFAFIDDHFDYHTSQDTYERLDLNTLQQQADYLMPLLDYLADADLKNLSAETDNVFFNFPGLGLINYPISWSTTLLVLTFSIFVILIILGLKRKKLVLKQIWIGFLPFLISMISIGLISFYGWELVLLIYPDYNEILHGFTYNGHYYMTAFIAISLWICLWIYQKFLIKNEALNLFIAPIFFWLLLNAAMILYLPGGSFFILVPLMTLITLFLFIFYHKSEAKKVIFSTIFMLPVLIVFSPIVTLFPVGLGLKMLIISALFIVMITSLFIPILSSYKGFKNLIKFFLVIGILSLASAAFSSDFNEENKKPDSIVYVRLADKNESYWASNDSETDEFTKQFLGDNPQKGSFAQADKGNNFIAYYKLYKKAQAISVKEPIIDIVLDSTDHKNRRITLTISPQRSVNRIILFSKGNMKVQSIAINEEGSTMPEDKDYLLDTEINAYLFSYYVTKPNVPLEISYEFLKDGDPDLILYEVSYDLLSNQQIASIKPDLKKRPRSIMEKAFITNDAIIVKKEIDL